MSKGFFSNIVELSDFGTGYFCPSLTVFVKFLQSFEEIIGIIINTVEGNVFITRLSALGIFLICLSL